MRGENACFAERNCVFGPKTPVSQSETAFSACETGFSAGDEDSKLSEPQMGATTPSEAFAEFLAVSALLVRMV